MGSLTKTFTTPMGMNVLVPFTEVQVGQVVYPQSPVLPKYHPPPTTDSVYTPALTVRETKVPAGSALPPLPQWTAALRVTRVGERRGGGGGAESAK